MLDTHLAVLMSYSILTLLCVNIFYVWQCHSNLITSNPLARSQVLKVVQKKRTRWKSAQTPKKRAYVREKEYGWSFYFCMIIITRCILFITKYYNNNQPFNNNYYTFRKMNSAFKLIQLNANIYFDHIN